MSSAAYLIWEKDTGVSGEDWAEFCSQHAIEHSPQTIGGNVYYAGNVEIKFGESVGDTPPDYAEQITLATFHFGKAMPEVARLAREVWLTLGGNLSADPEIRKLFVDQVANSQTLVKKPLRGDLGASPVAKNEMKVLATIEFPGPVYLAHEQAQGLPAEIEDPRSPWVRGVVPGGELIVLGVPLGIVHEVRPESEAQYEMGDDDPREWITHRTTVLLRLNLGALLGSSG